MTKPRWIFHNTIYVQKTKQTKRSKEGGITLFIPYVVSVLPEPNTASSKRGFALLALSALHYIKKWPQRSCQCDRGVVLSLSNINLSVYLIKCHAIKLYVDYSSHLFLTMALYWGKWTVSSFGCIIPWERGPDFNIHTLYIIHTVHVLIINVLSN